MIDLKPYQGHINNLCKLLRVQELELFGSATRDDFSPESDIDVLVRGKRISIHQVEAFLKFKDLEAPNDPDHKTYAALYAQGTNKLQASLSLTPAGDGASSSASAVFANDPRFNGLPHLTPKEPITAQGLGMLQLVATDDNIKAIDPALRITGTAHNRLKVEAIEDMIIVCYYSVEKSTA